MLIWHLILIAFIQGATEFLPVSSSGHLILLPILTGLQDQGLVIDVAAHVGTLGAVILYFRTDVGRAIQGFFRLLTGDVSTPNARLALCLILATVPVVIIGFVLAVTGLEEQMRSIAVIGWAMIVFGAVLYWADQRGATSKVADAWSFGDAIRLGLWQAIALIPGTSRSGITITGARQMGYTREDAARIAMLMSIPTITASGILLGIDVATTANAGAARDGAIVAVFSFIFALIALTLMMRLLRSVSFTPYVIYRFALGAILLWMAYS